MKKKPLSILHLIAICMCLILIATLTVGGAHKQEVKDVFTEDVSQEYNKEEIVVKDEAEKSKEDNVGTEIKNDDIEIETSNSQSVVHRDNLLIGSSVFGNKDALMLHKISIAEAGNQSVECMALIMLVILNRVESNKFPDSIEEVIFQEHKGTHQFSPIANGSFDEAQPNEKSYKAMELVLNNWNESQDALYFESCKGESWHSRNLKFLFKNGKMRFYTEF